MYMYDVIPIDIISLVVSSAYYRCTFVYTWQPLGIDVSSDAILWVYYTFMALVLGPYEGLFTQRSRISQNYTHNSKTFFKSNLTFYFICVVVMVSILIFQIIAM